MTGSSAEEGKRHLAQANSNGFRAAGWSLPRKHRAPKGRKNGFRDAKRLTRRLLADELMLSLCRMPRATNVARDAARARGGGRSRGRSPRSWRHKQIIAEMVSGPPVGAALQALVWMPKQSRTRPGFKRPCGAVLPPARFVSPTLAARSAARSLSAGPARNRRSCRSSVPGVRRCRG